MRKMALTFAAALGAVALGAHSPAYAQSASPQAIQAQIANGQAQTALSELQPVLQAHPDSGVAWYLTAEAQDAAGNLPAARTALANAEHFAPGLPFAKPDDVAALQSHLAGTDSAPVQPHSGISTGLIGIIVLVVVFLAFRMFRRRRYMAPGYQQGYGPPGSPGSYPYGSGPGGGMGMGMGGSILGGLAAGAGFAAGERVIDGMMGGGGGAANANPIDPSPNRDDGLNGSPGWDDGAGNSGPADTGGGFDPGNNW